MRAQKLALLSKHSVCAPASRPMPRDSCFDPSQFLWNQTSFSTLFFSAKLADSSYQNGNLFCKNSNVNEFSSALPRVSTYFRKLSVISNDWPRYGVLDLQSCMVRLYTPVWCLKHMQQLLIMTICNLKPFTFYVMKFWSEMDVSLNGGIEPQILVTVEIDI